MVDDRAGRDAPCIRGLARSGCGAGGSDSARFGSTRWPWATRSDSLSFSMSRTTPRTVDCAVGVYNRPDPRIVSIVVATTTLDETIPGDQPIAFIKMDIEGGRVPRTQGSGEDHQAVAACDRVRGREQVDRSGHGVTPDELYSLITATLGYELSTMRRWLDGGPAYTLEEFTVNWHAGPDYYFIGTAKMLPRPETSATVDRASKEHGITRRN